MCAPSCRARRVIARGSRGAHRRARDLLKKYKDAYYNGHPLVSDAAYDQLEDELRALDPARPCWPAWAPPCPQGQATGGRRRGHRVGEGPAQDPHGLAQQGRRRGRVPRVGRPLRGARRQGEAPQGAGRPVRHREAGRHLARGHLRGWRDDRGHHPRRRPDRRAHHRQRRPNEGRLAPAQGAAQRLRPRRDHPQADGHEAVVPERLQRPQHGVGHRQALRRQPAASTSPCCSTISRARTRSTRSRSSRASSSWASRRRISIPPTRPGSSSCTSNTPPASGPRWTTTSTGWSSAATRSARRRCSASWAVGRARPSPSSSPRRPR
jgi:hypothetical protein